MKEEKYKAPYVSRGAFPSLVNRREFLKRLGTLGGGIVVYFSIGDLSGWAQSAPFDLLFKNIPTDFNAYLRIG